MAKEKKILIIMGGMGRDGAERVISLISDYFCSKGWKVYIALLLFNKVGYRLNENITIVDLTFGDGARAGKIPKWLYGIRKIVKEIEPDEILSFVARVNVLTQLACFGLDCPIVVSERNDPYKDGRGKIVDILTNWLYPKAKAVVFQTKRAAGYFQKIKLKNSMILTNPISVTCERQKPKYGKIVTAGRLAEQKNQRMLIQAFANIVQEFPNAELTIYGEGKLRRELEELVQTLGLSKKVFLPGNVPNLHECICDASVFVLPSDYEGLSNALLEAMMLGIPCVSTDCAGADEYIEPGSNGYLVPVGDVNKMTQALKDILSYPEKAEKMGQMAKKMSVRFSEQTVLKKWYEAIES